MAAPQQLATVYATDENLAIRSSSDFTMLCPDWQKLAFGTDGAFTVGAPWVLKSASVIRPVSPISYTKNTSRVKGFPAARHTRLLLQWIAPGIAEIRRTSDCMISVLRPNCAR